MDLIKEALIRLEAVKPPVEELMNLELPLRDPLIDEDERLTSLLLDYISENLLSEDDGTGPRLLWVIERLYLDQYDTI